MKLLSTAALLVIALLFHGPASAGVVRYQWSFSGPSAGFSGSGTLDVDGNNLVTALDGTFGGNAMTLLAPGSYLFNNNLFSATEPHFQLGGLSFSTAVDNYNLLFESGFYFVLYAFTGGSNGTFDSVDGRFSATQIAVPEPASLALVALTLACIAIARGNPTGRQYH